MPSTVIFSKYFSKNNNIMKQDLKRHTHIMKYRPCLYIQATSKLCTRENDEIAIIISVEFIEFEFRLPQSVPKACSRVFLRQTTYNYAFHKNSVLFKGTPFFQCIVRFYIIDWEGQKVVKTIFCPIQSDSTQHPSCFFFFSQEHRIT